MLSKKRFPAILHFNFGGSSRGAPASVQCLSSFGRCTPVPKILQDNNGRTQEVPIETLNHYFHELVCSLPSFPPLSALVSFAFKRTLVTLSPSNQIEAAKHYTRLYLLARVESGTGTRKNCLLLQRKGNSSSFHGWIHPTKQRLDRKPCTFYRLSFISLLWVSRK